jgi:hypothetical protein
MMLLDVERDDRIRPKLTDLLDIKATRWSWKSLCRVIDRAMKALPARTHLGMELFD